MFRNCWVPGTSNRGFKNLVADSRGNDKNEVELNPQVPQQAFLLEIVGAMGLSVISKQKIDSYCIVTQQTIRDGKPSDRVIHRTQTIENDAAPIWTIKTKSVCIVRLPLPSSERGHKESSSIRVTLCRRLTGMSSIQNATSQVLHKSSVKFKDEVNGKTDESIIGSVQLSYDTLMLGNSQRQVFALQSSKYGNSVQLALRFRKASRLDCKTYEQLAASNIVPAVVGKLATDIAQSALEAPNLVTSRPTQPQNWNAADADFQQSVNTKVGIFDRQTKRVKIDGVDETAYRVRPFPDPKNPADTTFLTKQQLEQMTSEPSRVWVETAGDPADTYGSICLEVLGCDNLPNMDIEMVTGLTDAFIACVFEDNFVRTPVILDSLSPRWMPWTHRAFEFRIQHPSSILMLGVFDYDGSPLEKHDPIGRVVIVPTAFEGNTVYTLTYPLHDELRKVQGTMTVRLRIKWDNTVEASKALSFVRPPRYIINVQTDKAWRTLRYLTRGRTEMADVSLDTVKRYVNELLEHGQSFFYLLDVAAGILLWRGRVQLGNRSIWCPIHSIVLLMSAIVVVEQPKYLPSVFLYLIAYCLLWNNYYLSTHPNPWARVRSFARVTMSNSVSTSSRGVQIATISENRQEEHLEQLDMYRTLRVGHFLHSAIYTALDVYRVYSKNTPVDMSTVYHSGNILSKLYANYLSAAHAALQAICQQIRLLRNFVNWRVGSTYKFCLDLILFATIWMLFPFKTTLIQLCLRASVCCVLGPQNRLWDLLWIQKYYRTVETLSAILSRVPNSIAGMKQDIDERPSILETIVQSKWVNELAKSGRVVIEDNLKLQAMREARFGSYSETIPMVDSSRQASIPNHWSFAQPWTNPTSSSIHTTTTILHTGTGTGTPQTSATTSTSTSTTTSTSNPPLQQPFVDLATTEKSWSKVPGQRLYGTILPQPVSVLENPATEPSISNSNSNSNRSNKA